MRTVIPTDELETVLDNLGLPYSGINLSYSNAGAIGPLDGEILIALKEGHQPAHRYVEELRRKLPEDFPGVEFFFQPADIVTQILNFGQPAAVDVQILGPDMNASFRQAAIAGRRNPQNSRNRRHPYPSAAGPAIAPCWRWTGHDCSRSISTPPPSPRMC